MRSCSAARSYSLDANSGPVVLHAARMLRSARMLDIREPVAERLGFVMKFSPSRLRCGTSVPHVSKLVGCSFLASPTRGLTTLGLKVTCTNRDTGGDCLVRRSGEGMLRGTGSSTNKQGLRGTIVSLLLLTMPKHLILTTALQQENSVLVLDFSSCLRNSLPVELNAG